MNKTLCNYKIMDICRSDTDPKVFTYLAFLCSETGQGRCTATEIAAYTGLTDKQVRLSLEKLVAGGHCVLESRGRGGTIVTMCWGKKRSTSELGVMPDGEDAEGKFSEKPALEGANSIEAPSCGSAPDEGEERADNRTLNHFRESNSDDQGRGRSETPSSTPYNPPPSSPQEQPAKYFLSRREAVAEVAAITKNEAVRSAACEWIAMRYAKRGNHKLTAKAIRGAFQKLRNMGYNTESQAVACFEQSIEHLWDGLFEVKR